MGDDSELGVSFLPTSNLHTPDECKAASEIAGLDTSVQQLLKFAFLFGSLTLQETEQALAASDFVNQFQSTSFFGDLSDISTGFASVRKISLKLLQFVYGSNFKLNMTD